MRRLFLSAMVTLLCLASTAQAYDEDTHFYGTYAMARHAGIKHEVAMKIALSTQWMDESFISDPTSMIFMPVTGIKKRRLLHFPSSRLSTTTSAAQRSIMGFDDLGEFTQAIGAKVVSLIGEDVKLDSINFFTQTSEDHPFASQMLMEGLKEGNLLKAGAGLHTLEDSFAHAGTPAEEGHAFFWHWPDRPYNSVEKYKRMVRTLMDAMVGIRTALPPEAVDCDLLNAGMKNCEANAQRLTDTYLALVLPTISRDITRAPEYVRVALREFFDRAQKAGYTKITAADFEYRASNLHLVEGQTSSYDAVSEFVKNVLADETAGRPTALDLNKILQDISRLNSANAVTVSELMANYGRDHDLDASGVSKLARVIAEELLIWHVPTELNDTHRMEFEDDKDLVRKTEMEMRIAGMQSFIYKNYNTKIQFIGNNTNTDVGFYHEMHLNPLAEPNYSTKEGFKALPDVAYATFNLQEKKAFNEVILSYLFPQMKTEDVNGLIEAFAKIKILIRERSAYYAERQKIEDAHQGWRQWVQKKVQLLKLDWQYKRYRQVSAGVPEAVSVVMSEIAPRLKPLVKDLLTTHNVPDNDVYTYRRASKMAEYMKNGTVPQLLGANDTWKSQDLIKPTGFWQQLFNR